MRLVVEDTPKPGMDLACFSQWCFNVKHRNSCELECWPASEVSVLAASCFASGPRDPALLTTVMHGFRIQR